MTSGLRFKAVLLCLAAEILLAPATNAKEDVLHAILDRLEDLEKTNAHLENAVSDLQKENSYQRKINADLQTKMRTISEDYEQIAADIKLDKTDNRYKRLVLSQGLPVTFTARINPRYLDHVAPSSIIPFNDILTNYGGGFSANSSVFVAPMAGIYMFSCSLMDHFARDDGSGDKLHANIVKNGNQVLARVFAHAEEQTYRDQGANTVFVNLNSGDKVWVEDWNSKDLSVGGELYSTFSGYLLWPME